MNVDWEEVDENERMGGVSDRELRGIVQPFNSDPFLPNSVALRRILARFEIRWFMIPLVLKVPCRSPACIVVRMKVLSRDGTGVVELQVRWDCEVILRLWSQGPSYDSEIADVLRENVQKLIMHEIDEALHWDGSRKWDPHAGEPPFKLSKEFS